MLLIFLYMDDNVEMYCGIWHWVVLEVELPHVPVTKQQHIV